MLLADQRSVEVKNLDFISRSPDHRTVTIYSRGEEVEVIDLVHVVSLKFHEPDLLETE